MWKAEKIELKRNSDEAFYREYALYLGDCYSLEINEVLISNAIPEYAKSLPLGYGWETLVCTECGHDGCNAAGRLELRRNGEVLWIIPDFGEMDGFEEYALDQETGNRYCAPHEWYEMGILVIEGDMLKQLLEVLPSIPFESVKEPTPEELDLINKWEECVRLKPDGFMRKEMID